MTDRIEAVEQEMLPRQAVAIVGMAGRFPGAAGVEELWRNLLAGKDSITRFTPEQSQDRRTSGAGSSNYVGARGVLDDAACFDAEYFGISPREAERMDPQHRVFLEVCVSALENSGYVPDTFEGEIGLFAGCSLNTYLLANLSRDRAFLDELTSNYQVGEFFSALGNDKDFLTSRVAYKLNLRGPCMTVQSACATSLVAVAQACQSLLTYQCEMALAGGVSITFPQYRGHLHQDGSISSRDGHCRPFDADASGTVFSHGAGVVVLKRLEDAVRDGDNIVAVVRGFAVNNDGAQKAGYMAPGVDGQSRVIAAAQAMAGITPDSVSYIEAHGTGTPMGDPIELAALVRVFRAAGAREGSCTVGVVKGNIGHLDSAAGVTGLIKTALSLRERTIPGLAHFANAHPDLPLAGTPFVFTSQAKPWTADGPLRAGVSAFGVGGVNAHVVLEEAPLFSRGPASQGEYPVCLSARSPQALAAMRQDLAAWLEANAEAELADVSYTLAVGRKPQPQRFACVASSAAEAVALLRGGTAVSGDTHAATEACRIAEAWRGGGRIDLTFFQTDTRCRIALPGTVFQKTVHWVEPPARDASHASPPTQDVNVTAHVAAPAATPQPTGELIAMPVIETQSRLPRLRRQVAQVFLEFSGMEIAEADNQAPFFELGFDSLFLTQATSSLEKAFGVSVSFRQLNDDLGSVEALAHYLDSKMPADASQPAAAAPAEASAGNGTPAQTLMEHQIARLGQMFQQQIAALRQIADPSSVAAPSAAIPAAAPGQAIAANPPAAALSRTEDAAAIRHGSYRPLQVRNSDTLNRKQSEYIASLVSAYTRKTPTSKQRTQAARAHLADPRAVAGFRPQWKEMVYPLVTDRASGSRIWDVDGNEYIDIVNGYGCIMFGHSPSFVVDAVRRQIDLGVAIGPQSHLAGEVAAQISAMTGNDRVTFCNTGSEAVMAAMRVARMVTGRDRVVYFAGDYHGTFDEVLARSTPRGTFPLAPGIPAASMSNITVLEYGVEASLDYVRKNGSNIAAVLIEPVQTRHPELQPIEFIRELRAITEATGTAFILDEVVTGFRLAPGGVQQAFGIRADLCTYGKVIGGGYPIGVLSGKARFMDALDGGYWQYGDASVPEAGMTFFAGTFVRHPQAMAAAHAVITHLAEQGPELQASLNRKASELAAAIDTMFVERGVPCRVHAFASWFYFTFPSEAKLSPLFYYSMRAKGIHIQEGYPCFLTTAHSAADLQRIEECFRDTIAEMQAADAMPCATPALAAAAIAATLPDEVPLTEAQREVYLAAALGDGANCAFNESLTIRLQAALDHDRLQAAVDAVVQRHDALRAVIALDGDNLRVTPQPRTSIAWHIDFSSEAATEAAAAAYIAGDAACPFHLQESPLVRFAVFAAADTTLVVITAHHIVLDGWSANILVEEIGAAYSKGPSTLAGAGAAMAFRAYALREQERQRAGAFAANEQYWVSRFAGKSPMLDLPVDRPRAESRSFAGATLTGELSADWLDAARKLGRKNGCSLFVTLLSSFQLLLHRLTGQQEVVTGISTAAQALQQGQVLIGHCVNFLPMLSSLDGNETVVEHLRATRTHMLDAQEHQEFTFGTLLQRLTLPRDSSRLPLIEVQFNLEKAGGTSAFAGVKCDVRSNPKRFVNTDWFLNLIESPAGLSYTLDYNTALFDRSTVERWMACWATLVASAATTPEQKALALPMLPQQQLEEVLSRHNRTAMDFGPHISAAESVRRWAAATPQAVAITCDGRSWTYAELEQYVGALASRLTAEGLQPGGLSAVCISRSLEMAGAVLAIHRAGGAYVPLDPRHPQERLQGILDDAQVPLLLTDGPTVLTARRIVNVAGMNAAAGLPAILPQSGMAESLAYVIYTSGSTGKPKGVAIEHGALTNLLRSMAVTPGLRQQDTLLAVTTIAFDIATLELLLPLTMGAKLVIATESEATDGAALVRMVRNHGVTVMQATPGLWHVVLEAGLTPSDGLKVLCGGEALSGQLAGQLTSISDNVWNVYGPTETTIWSAAGKVTPQGQAQRIGPPIANTQIYVLGPEDQPVPMGVTGEIAIAGDGLARGYWKRPELTADRFRRNPFGKGRIYLTGDLGRQHSDGTVEILGRTDFQVKVRGYRIELGEIEAALRAHPAVREAAVVARKTPSSSTQLLAFIEPNRPDITAEALIAELRAQLTGTLPEYMVPAHLEVLEALPRNTNGKVDRKLLLARETETRMERVMVHPISEEQEKLVAIWSEVLKQGDISTTDSVFDLGADSLAIFRIAARCQREELPIKAAHIFQYRTILRLTSEVLEKTSTTQPGAAAPRIQAASREQFRVKR